MDFQKLNKKGEKEQLAYLFDCYGKRLFSYAHLQWKVHEDIAWELVYESLYKIVEVRNEYSFDSEKKFRSFLFRIFINKLKNKIKEVKNKGIVEETLIENKATVATEKEENVRPELKVLNELLDQLEDWQRILLLMRSQGFAYSEISKYTSIEEKNLKVYYGRLKKKIAKEMESQLKMVEHHE